MPIMQTLTEIHTCVYVCVCVFLRKTTSNLQKLPYTTINKKTKGATFEPTSLQVSLSG